jgi:hypothetical protein
VQFGRFYMRSDQFRSSEIISLRDWLKAGRLWVQAWSRSISYCGFASDSIDSTGGSRCL